MTVVENAIGYCRVSSDEQKERIHSIGIQKKGINLKKEMIEEERGINISFIKIFESSESAWHPEKRKDFYEMINMCGNPALEVKHLFFKDLSRMTRNDLDHMNLKAVCKKRNIQIHYSDHNFTNDASGELAEDSERAQAKYHSNRTSEKVKEVVLERFQQGKWSGVAPYGYKNNTILHTIEPEPREADNVKWLFNKYASGKYSTRSLAKEFNDSSRYYTDRKLNINKSIIDVILKRKQYLGYTLHKGEYRPGIHTPIITIELFNLVQRIFKSRKNPRMSQLFFTYGSGLIYCEKCGCSITVERKIKPNGKEYILYHCTNGCGNCKITYLQEPELEKQIGEKIKVFNIPDKLKRPIFRTLHVIYRDDLAENEKLLSDLDKREAKIKENISKAYDDKLSGYIDEEFWRQRNNEWQDELLCIRSKRNAISKLKPDMIEKFERTFELLQHLYPSFIRQNPLQKRELVQLLLSNLTLDGRKLHCDWKEPFNWIAEWGNPIKKHSRLDSNQRPTA